MVAYPVERLDPDEVDCISRIALVQNPLMCANEGGPAQVFKSSSSPKSHVATVLHQPLIEPDDVKWRLADQSASTVLNCAAQVIQRPLSTLNPEIA